MAVSNTNSCVLYVLGSSLQTTSNPRLVEAQRCALAYELPIAVIYILDSTVRRESSAEVQIERLKNTEKTLNKLRVPFMIFFGEVSERLTVCMTHLQPRAIFFDYDPSRLTFDNSCIPPGIIRFIDVTNINSSSLLVRHPYNWPGRVMSIQELENRILATWAIIA